MKKRLLNAKKWTLWLMTLVLTAGLVSPASAQMYGDYQTQYQEGGAAAAGAAFGDTEENAYLIGPNNLLHIKILNEGAIQQVYRVDGLGFITHPLVGRVELGGLTVAEAEERMRSALSGDYIINPQVSIFVLEHSRFSVLGEVRNPGNYEIVGRMTLVEAISIAGGFTPVANERKVTIVRQDPVMGETTMEVNVEEIMEGKKAGEHIFVEAGDVINVPKSFF